MLLLAILLLTSVILSSAQDRDDRIVLKAYPSNIHCRRNAAQRRREVAELNRQLRERRLTARSTLYRACYKYSIVGRNACQLDTEAAISEIVTMLDSMSVANTGGQVIIAQTPIKDDGLYPSDTVCFYVIGNKRAGFVYQYVEGFFGQDLQGGITIRTKTDSNNDLITVTDGKCHDFFEFREKIQDKRFGGIDTLVTCGNQSDPRIQFSMDLLDPMVPDALTLVFRSDNTVQKRGIYLIICEIDTAASSPTAHGGKKKRQTSGSAPQGLQGRHGETGLPGKQGEKGRSGINGKTGTAGKKGKRGVMGVRGPEGPPSTVGGYQGQQGKQGPVGPKGVPCHCKALKNCIPGHKGDKGWSGTYGPRGVYGRPGLRGHPGKQGSRGLPGVRGRKGSKGSNGLNGFDGPSGEPGPHGPHGKPGPPGPPGLAGCPLPPGRELSRHMTKLGYITEVTEKIYHHTVNNKVKRSVGKFHNHLVDEMIEHKEKLESTKHSLKATSTDTYGRATRQIIPSEECGGVPLIPGTKGEPGMRGFPGPPGQNGLSGRPGTAGVHGINGDPGKPGFSGPIGLTGKRGPPGDKGEPGPAGIQGLPGQCECYKYMISSSYGHSHTNAKRASSRGYGLKGPHGDTGSPGPRGPPGYTGKRGYPGSPGKKGPVGYRGADGVTGRIGPAGSPGPKGLPGPRGLAGSIGPAGPQGPPACECNNLRIVLDRYGFIIPPRLLTDEESVVLYNENEVNITFVEIPCIRREDASIMGSKGEQGKKGYQGPHGSPGKPGADGVIGELGQKGAKGNRGYPGPKGFRGSNGPPGKPGLPGVQGCKGYKGEGDLWCILSFDHGHHSKLVRTQCPQGCPDGAKGTKGKRGPTGPRGFPGSTGLTGFAGPRGPRGYTGLPGYPGDEGSAGLPGNRGPRGHRGLPGDPGLVGSPGEPGPSDSCPEFDGVDLNEFFQPTTEEVNDLEVLLETQDAVLAMDRINSSFPVLRELASFITNGGIIPQPPVTCARIDLVNVNNDSATVEFIGISPFTCQLDYRPPKPCTSPVTYSGLSAGRHSVDITGRNKTCKANTTFTIPVWLNVNSLVVKCDTVRVNFSANGRTECKLDNGMFRYCRSSYFKTWLSSDQHTITIRASDGLGGYIMKTTSFTIQLDKLYWSSWQEWSPCTKHCGGGTSRRTRICLFPKCRDYNHYQCDGKCFETRKCNEQCCQEKAYWGPWAHWSSCSKSCGGGITFRKRQCFNSKCPHPDYKNCVGRDYEENKCNIQYCPEKSNWGAWTEWSTCSSSCSGGLSFRRRRCVSSKCPYRKSNCYGNGYEKRTCNKQCCQKKPYWSAWTHWSPCSKTCGGGRTYRHRTCCKSKCPHPLYLNCPGEHQEQKTCNEQCCPEKPYWGPWAKWSPCSKTCGGGITYRKRKCSYPNCLHSHYNKKCLGNDHEINRCNNYLYPESETSSLRVKLKVTRQTNCVYISYTLTQPATTSCYVDRKQWDKCYSPLILCLGDLQQGDHFGYISATNKAKQKTTTNFRFTLHE